MSEFATWGPLTAWQRLRAGIPVGDWPAAVVFRCSDAGLAPPTVLGHNSGSLIEVSTWGHTVDTGVLATLEYAVTVHDVPLIVVLGHPGCHAMRAAMQAWNEADLPNDVSRTTVEQVISSIVRRGAPADSVESISSAHIVETGLSILERSTVISRRIDSGECAIVCATTQPADGRLRVHATIGAVGEVDDSLMECV